MSDEINWEPQSVADLATQLSRIGNDYRSAIADVYSAFNSIGLEQKWVGKNFNIIANEILNTSRSTFEGWSDYLQVTVPRTVYQIAEMQAERGGGSVSFSLTPNSVEISNVENTEEKADGSQRLDATAVRATLNGVIPTNCQTASTRLQDYYGQFQELGTLNGNAAILEIYKELDSILGKTRQILETFQDQVNETAEKSIGK